MIDPSTHIWWIASRASGVVALVLITISVAIGLTMTAKLMRQRKLGPALMAVHEHTALIGLIAIAIHGITLMGDPFLHPTPTQIAVPLTIDYRPVFTGLGIIAGWLAALLGLTFYVRKRIGNKLWRKAHRATFAVWVLGLVHTIGAGTDANTPWLREFMVLTSVPMLALFVKRLYGSDRVVLRGPFARRGLVETKTLDQVGA